MQAPLFEPLWHFLSWILHTDMPNYLFHGNWKSIRTETTSKVGHGAPTDISGVYLRNGPNADYIPSDNRYHVFDGDGMIHAVRIKDGTVQYCNRFVKTPRLLKE